MLVLFETPAGYAVFKVRTLLGTDQSNRSLTLDAVFSFAAAAGREEAATSGRLV